MDIFVLILKWGALAAFFVVLGITVYAGFCKEPPGIDRW